MKRHRQAAAQVAAAGGHRRMPAHSASSETCTGERTQPQRVAAAASRRGRMPA